ncbi:MAG: aminotransferase class I/II-fold pyridoxal phosphate-dependent enzyme [Bacteroidales bacterium]
MEGPPGTEVVLNGKKVLYFAGTDYFQLHSHPDLQSKAADALWAYGMSSATSRTLTGTTPLLKDLEQTIATFYDAEEAIYLPSGYLCNHAGLSALNELERVDVIFLDEDAHDSLREASLATGKQVIIFESGNVDDLALKLSVHSGRKVRPLIATDGVFPARGVIAPLNQYLDLAEKYRGLIWIDDAHATGILGETGKGTCEHLGLESPLIFCGSTLSKAFGAYGGMIPGDSEFIGTLRKGSVASGSNAPLSAAMAASLRGLELVQKHPEWRKKLNENVRYLRKALESIHIYTGSSELPILAFRAGGAQEMLRVQQQIMREGIFIQYTRYRGSGKEGLLRMVLFSTHTKEQIDRLVEALDRYVERFN